MTSRPPAAAASYREFEKPAGAQERPSGMLPCWVVRRKCWSHEALYASGRGGSARCLAGRLAGCPADRPAAAAGQRRFIGPGALRPDGQTPARLAWRLSSARLLRMHVLQSGRTAPAYRSAPARVSSADRASSADGARKAERVAHYSSPTCPGASEVYEAYHAVEINRPRWVKSGQRELARCKTRFCQHNVRAEVQRAWPTDIANVSKRAARCSTFKESNRSRYGRIAPRS